MLVGGRESKKSSTMSLRERKARGRQVSPHVLVAVVVVVVVVVGVVVVVVEVSVD